MSSDFKPFIYVDNILTYIRNTVINYSIFSKKKYSKFDIHRIIKEYRNKIFKKFEIIQLGYNDYVFKKEIFSCITMCIEDMVMSDDNLPNIIKDNVCNFISNERTLFNNNLKNNI